MNPVRFGDKYILLDQIGAGGVAEVFRGKLTREQGFEKLIVIKKLLPEHNTNREMVEIFFSEARLAALLQHDNIAATYDFGELDGEYFLAMEYLFGKNLHLVMARARDHQDQFSPAHALAVCSRICEGMEYAHNLTDLQNNPINLVHRDLTPHNIFITYDGKVKILDFGVAKAELFDNKTREGVVKGKISYMSPERLSGEDVDFRSDIFSIGILLYEMIGNKRMYQGDTAELIRKCLTADFENLRDVSPGLAPQIYTILDKALAVEVSQRYQSCAQMQADIDDLLFEMQHRSDSKFLKDSIQELFTDEYNDEQHKVAVLFTDSDEKKLFKRDKTDITIPRKPETDTDADKTMVLTYQPAVQLLKSRIADLTDWFQGMLEKSGSLIGDLEIDKRYIWGGAGVSVGIVLLIAVLQTGDDATSESVMQEESKPAAATTEVIETATPAGKPPAEKEDIEADEVKVSADEIVGQSGISDEQPVPELQPAVARREIAPLPQSRQSIPPNTAKIPVLKTREMKIKKTISAPPAAESVKTSSSDVRPLFQDMETMPQKTPVDVTGQTLSFEEAAENRTRRRNILMLHTRAEEAMQQGRLLEPVQYSAYTYYREILDLDPEDNRAKDALSRIGDKYGDLAETALTAKQFDRAAEHAAKGLKVMPGNPRLVAIDERMKQERADHIYELSEKARLCLDAGKLSTPADDSAYFYYNEILHLDPESELVRQGYQNIGDKYAVLADHAFQEFDYVQAEKYVRRGLQVAPDHYYLKYIQQELQRSDLERVGQSVKKRINKLFSE